jgi:hypothetical protein
MVNKNKNTKKETADNILETVEKIIPGITGFFKKAEESKVFGWRIKEIREEINRKFGGLKK